ncbi:MAG: HNH endonuclease, partial [Clostridiales bacterium]|nr:HNH endonuclease [Clostridiales bacterium]
RCCICGVDEISLLNASHIKPWSQSDEHEKLDSGNGLLLCPNHDKLFDRGYISFDDDGRILVSARLSEASRVFMNIDKKMHIQVTEDNKDYLRYHRKFVFL